MTSAERRALLPLLREVSTGPVASTRSAAAALLARFAKQRRPAPQRKVEKKAKLLFVKERTREIREAVIARAQRDADGCELCGGPGYLDLHHLESGSGRRVQMQAVENCMALCRFCHREYHRDPMQFRGAIETWCARYGHPLPSRFKRSACVPPARKIGP